MAHISIELVPRSAESVAADLDVIRLQFPSVVTVNIPDLLNFQLRSWEACRIAVHVVHRAIPHVRAMDFEPHAAAELVQTLVSCGLREVLVVRGDAPQELAHRVYPTSSADLVAALKRSSPNLKVYAGFDPYRSGLRAELENVRAKLDAGADGFFTQPFFDLRFQDLCADLLTGREVYWGISPVVTVAGRRYWEVKNRAFFPPDFEPTLTWNRGCAARAIAWAQARESNLYFMPIRVGIQEYLVDLL